MTLLGKILLSIKVYSNDELLIVLNLESSENLIVFNLSQLEKQLEEILCLQYLGELKIKGYHNHYLIRLKLLFII